jgi:uncharacterized OB-fold protein
MSYLITHLWTLPKLSTAQPSPSPQASADEDRPMMATTCDDCHQYSFPPSGQCRHCRSMRVRTVALSGEQRAHPGTLIFGTRTHDKPN